MPVINPFDLPPAILVPFLGVLGLLVGSFLNVVGTRLPRMMLLERQQYLANALRDGVCGDLGPALLSRVHGLAQPSRPRLSLAWPASFCPTCGCTIRPWHNIPVLGWLWLRGRCKDCHNPISGQYPLVELAAGLLAAACAYQFQTLLLATAAACLCWALLVLSIIDLRHHLLPDTIVLPLMWLGLLCNAENLFCTLPQAVTGAVMGYLMLWGLYHAHHILTGRQGLGHGDFKLLAALGAWFGAAALPLIMLMSAAGGIVVGGGLLLIKHRDGHTPIPYGPWLALAGCVFLFLGTPLTTAVTRWLAGA